MAEISLTQLQSFLDQTEIPVIKRKPKTFLGIARQPHYENVLSNLYAFFFNPSQEHGFGELFIRSFVELINDNVEFALDIDESLEIKTEYKTSKRGRIDLLIRNKIQAIIIENKVYHTLENDLNDYWDTLLSEGYQNDNITGILLSLKIVPRLTDSRYLNLTHFDFIMRVKQNMSSFQPKKEKYSIFLEDLIQNIINLTKSNVKSENIEFYQANYKNINQIIEFNSALERHVKNEVIKAGKQIKGVKMLQTRKGNNIERRLRYFTSKNSENLRLVPVFEGILNGQSSIYVVVEMRNNLLDDRSIYDSIDFSKEEIDIISQSSPTFKATHRKWAHFARRDYNLSSENIADLSTFILNRIEKDHLYSIFIKIDMFLKGRK